MYLIFLAIVPGFPSVLGARTLDSVFLMRVNACVAGFHCLAGHVARENDCRNITVVFDPCNQVRDDILRTARAVCRWVMKFRNLAVRLVLCAVFSR